MNGAREIQGFLDKRSQYLTLSNSSRKLFSRQRVGGRYKCPDFLPNQCNVGWEDEKKIEICHFCEMLLSLLSLHF